MRAEFCRVNDEIAPFKASCVSTGNKNFRIGKYAFHFAALFPFEQFGGNSLEGILRASGTFQVQNARFSCFPGTNCPPWPTAGLVTGRRAGRRVHPGNHSAESGFVLGWLLGPMRKFGPMSAPVEIAVFFRQRKARYKACSPETGAMAAFRCLLGAVAHLARTPIMRRHLVQSCARAGCRTVCSKRGSRRSGSKGWFGRFPAGCSDGNQDFRSKSNRYAWRANRENGLTGARMKD